MPKIEIDEEVFEFLERNARSFVETTPNAVLRRILLENDESSGEKRSVERSAKPGGRRQRSVDTDSFIRQVLSDRFGGGYKRVGRYRYMFESDGQRIYFQNFNKKETANLWYRVRESALQDLKSSGEDSLLCLTNPAQGLVYVLPVAEVIERAQANGWDGEDLEVNIDPADDRWRELDWDLSGHLERPLQET